MAAKKAAGEAAPVPKEIFQQLTQVAAALNAASDQLTQPVRTCEAALKTLNLGVSAWVILSKHEHDSGVWWDRSVGYTQHAQNWQIVLRYRRGDEERLDTEEVTPFDAAPRWMRTAAVAKLPELLEALLGRAKDTIAEVNSAMRKAGAFAADLAALAAPDAPWAWKERLRVALLEIEVPRAAHAVALSEVEFADNKVAITAPIEFQGELEESILQVALDSMEVTGVTVSVQYALEGLAGKGGY